MHKQSLPLICDIKNEGEKINPALESFALQSFFIIVSWNLWQKECAHLGHSQRLDHSDRPSKGLTQTGGLDLRVGVSDFPQGERA
jgi:hypothetical protein